MPEDGMPEPAGFGVREIHRPGDRQQTAPSDDTDGRSDRAAGHRGGIATAAWKVARASVHDLSRDLGRRVADARVDVATQDEPGPAYPAGERVELPHVDADAVRGRHLQGRVRCADDDPQRLGCGEVVQPDELQALLDQIAAVGLGQLPAEFDLGDHNLQGF